LPSFITQLAYFGQKNSNLASERLAEIVDVPATTNRTLSALK
jgi:hypothetical protein